MLSMPVVLRYSSLVPVCAVVIKRIRREIDKKRRWNVLAALVQLVQGKGGALNMQEAQTLEHGYLGIVSTFQRVDICNLPCPGL
jgi:hypothetical protein